MIKRAFTEHPASVGESYVEHMGMAFGFGSKMVISGLACLLHGLFPFLFVTTGKRCIEDLHQRMVVCRDKRLQQSQDVTAQDMAAQDMAAMERKPANMQAAE